VQNLSKPITRPITARPITARQGGHQNTSCKNRFVADGKGLFQSSVDTFARSLKKVLRTQVDDVALNTIRN
jgi:hypothetical protein